jgi:hypothetical protein
LKIEVGVDGDGRPVTQGQGFCYYRVYEEHKKGVLTLMVYLKLKEGARTEYPMTQEQIAQIRGFKKADLSDLVKRKLLRRYTVEDCTEHVYFLSEVRSALKSLK